MQALLGCNRPLQCLRVHGLSIATAVLCLAEDSMQGSGCIRASVQTRLDLWCADPLNSLRVCHC